MVLDWRGVGGISIRGPPPGGVNVGLGPGWFLDGLRISKVWILECRGGGIPFREALRGHPVAF